VVRYIGLSDYIEVRHGKKNTTVRMRKSDLVKWAFNHWYMGFKQAR